MSSAMVTDDLQTLGRSNLAPVTQPAPQAETREESGTAPPARRRLPLGRLLRAVLAIAALGTGVWAVGHKLSTVYSLDGVVNAELTMLRAPARGAVTGLPAAKGQWVERGQQLLLLDNRSEQLDDVRRLELEHVAATAQVASLRQQIDAFQAAEQQFAENLKRFEVAAVHGAERRLAEAEAEARLAEAARERDASESVRLAAIAGNAASSVSEVDRARSAARMSHEAAVAAAERVKRVRGELEAMRAGIYLDSSYNNVPYQQQRADDLRLRLTELRGRLSDQEAVRDRLAATLAYQKQLPKYRAQIPVTAPSAGLVWDALAPAGSDVNEGDPLLAVLDPQKLFAVVFLDAKYYDACAAGATVDIRFAGTYDWTPAKVTHVLGGASRLDERPLAAALPKASQKRTAVLVEIDALAAGTDRADAAAMANFIGRKVEVRIKRDVGAARVLRDLVSRS